MAEERVSAVFLINMRHGGGSPGNIASRLTRRKQAIG